MHALPVLWLASSSPDTAGNRGFGRSIETVFAMELSCWQFSVWAWDRRNVDCVCRGMQREPNHLRHVFSQKY